MVTISAPLVRSLVKYAEDGDASSELNGVVLGACTRLSDNQDAISIWAVLRDQTALDEIQPMLPGGIDVVGGFCIVKKVDPDMQNIASMVPKKHSLVLVYAQTTKRVHLVEVSQDRQSVVEKPLEIIECRHAQEFLRAIGYEGFRCGFHFQSHGTTAFRHDLERYLHQLSTTNSNELVFQWPSKRSSKKKQTSTATTNALKTLAFGSSLIQNVVLLQNLSAASNDGPVLTIPIAAASTNSSVCCHCDVLVFLPVQTLVSQTSEALRSRLYRQLQQLATVVKAQVGDTGTSDHQASCVVSSHHFALVGATLPLTMCTVEADDKHFETTGLYDQSVRVRLNRLLFQPPNQPVFDPSRCSLVRQESVLGSLDVLVNVHEGLGASGVPQGQQYLVDGFYGYYHYMQQQMNDKGWGCAYRSLQTLASWLFLNQYTDKATLSHQEIQRALVKIGDKPSSFINSREWIGSMEVGYVLDELYGIAFRNLYVSAGPDLVDKAQELKAHFLTQGTPVMMGGGNLAFTLLGIDYNETTGDCAFLILDPHYVGPEDLEIIQTKSMALEGYKAVPCGWRKASTFAKTSFYNLCLPQRPDLV